MPGPLIVVTGTGTGIGKTHVACAALRRAAEHGPVLGYKPVESGLDGPGPSDAARLEAASTFHVQQSPGLRLRAPLSPHLAARLEGKRLDWSEIVRFVTNTRAAGVPMLLELPGGLFSPLADGFRSVDALASLEPTATVLLAPNRLGVLHDIGATLAGAKSLGAVLHAVGLVDPDTADDSTAHNPAEVQTLIDSAWLGVWPRGSGAELSRCDATAALVRLWLP